MHKISLHKARLPLLYSIILWCSCIAIKAQTIPKSTLGLGSDINLFYNFDKDSPSGRIQISPNIEYYFLNNLGVGVRWGLDYSKITDRSITIVNTEQELYPYLRYFLYKGASVDVGGSFDLLFDNDFTFRWGVGYSFFVTNRWALTPHLSFQHDFKEYAVDPFKMRFSIGLEYFIK